MDRRWLLVPVVMVILVVAYQSSTLEQFVSLPLPRYRHSLFGASDYYITLDFKGRLGNLLFEYASLYGISKWSNLTAAVTNEMNLNKIFNLNCKKVHRFTVTFRRHIETAACAFDPRTKQLGSDKHVMLNGYYQSWKYFKHVEDDIGKQFAFQDVILKNAVTQFHSLMDKANVTMSSSSQTYVGVHVRRGDMVHSDAMVNYGYVAAGVDYIQRALAYMQEKYKHVVFVVASDDIQWCRNNFPQNYKVVFIEQANSPEVDMAILTQCNHTVLTSGSFGWWSAWLTGGETIYYKGYPRPNSQLDNMIVAADYRPPEWIPM